MNEIKVVGKQNFMDNEITVMEGGFGEGKRIISVDTICKIHNSRTDKVNELINNNIDEFEEGIDIIDLMKDENSLNLAKGLGLITNNRQKYCYILSEQGYMLLTSFMKTDKAKELRKQFRREYFTMREVINSDEQLKAMYLLKAVESTGEESVMAIKCYSDIRIKEATKPLLEDINKKEEIIHKQEDDIQIKKDIIEGFTNDIDLYTKRNIVNRVIKKCTNGNYSGRYKEMYKCFKETFSIDLEARCKGYNLKQTKKKDQLSVIKYCEKFNHIDGLYEVACKLYHTEVQELLKELGKIVE